MFVLSQTPIFIFTGELWQVLSIGADAMSGGVKPATPRFDKNNFILQNTYIFGGSKYVDGWTLKNVYFFLDIIDS